MRAFAALGPLLLLFSISIARELPPAPVPAPQRASLGDSSEIAPLDIPIVIESRSPTGALLRSVVLPGWGQFYNDEPLKGVIYGSVELGLLGWLIYENSVAEDARHSGDDAAYQVHRQRRLDLIWYTSASWLLGMLDAYVDAHLYSFQAENEEFEREVAFGAAFCIRF